MPRQIFLVNRAESPTAKANNDKFTNKSIFILTLNLFVNIYNPFSPYLTLLLNIILLSYLIISRRSAIIVHSRGVVFGSLAILLWLCFVAVIRSEIGNEVFLKYIRSCLAITVLAIIFGSWRIPPKTFLFSLKFVLLFHIALLFLQVVYPDISTDCALIFGFNRDVNIIQEFNMRKLGASSSYDTASLLSVCSLIVFGLSFLNSRLKKDVFFFLISYAALMFSSRVGMVFGSIIVFGFVLRLNFENNLFWKLVSICLLTLILVASIYIIQPLFYHSTENYDINIDYIPTIFSTSDYGTTGTWDLLTSDYLRPLNKPLAEIIIGYAVDPNSIGLETDIGYVKMIYHVGVIGTMIIIGIHFQMMFWLYQISKKFKTSTNTRLLNVFTLFLIPISLLFNYKSLEIYSRGIGDFIFIMYFYISALVRRGTFSSRHLPKSEDHSSVITGN